MSKGYRNGDMTEQSVRQASSAQVMQGQDQVDLEVAAAAGLEKRQVTVCAPRNSGIHRRLRKTTNCALAFCSLRRVGKARDPTTLNQQAPSVEPSGRPLGACERIVERRLHLQGADGSVVGLYHVTRTGMCERHLNASFVKCSI